MLLPDATEITDPSAICSVRLPPAGTSTVSLICTASPRFSTRPRSVHDPLTTTTVPAGVAAAAPAQSIRPSIANSTPTNLRPMILDPGAADPRSRTIKQFIYSLIDLCKILLGSPVAIAHFSALDGFSAWVRALGRLSTPRAAQPTCAP